MWKNPEYLKKRKEITKNKWNEISFRKKVILCMNKESVKKKKNNSLKESLKDPVIKKKYSDSKKKMRENEDYRKKQIRLISLRWYNKEYKQAISKKIKDLWSNDDYVDRHVKTYYKLKDFILPSGKVIKVQGYEGKVLQILLKKFSEEDIITEKKEIKNIIGSITYFHNNTFHNYYPDMYIKSINTIIEVKSKWTYEKRLEENLKNKIRV